MRLGGKAAFLESVENLRTGVVSANDTSSRTGDSRGIEAKILLSAPFGGALPYLVRVVDPACGRAGPHHYRATQPDRPTLWRQPGTERDEEQAYPATWHGSGTPKPFAKPNTPQCGHTGTSSVFQGKAPGQNRSRLQQSWAEVFAKAQRRRGQSRCAQGFRQNLDQASVLEEI